MPSDIIAELPVTDAAINLVTDISALPISAAIMTFFEPDAIFCPHHYLPAGPFHLLWNDTLAESRKRARPDYFRNMLTVTLISLMTESSSGDTPVCSCWVENRWPITPPWQAA